MKKRNIIIAVLVLAVVLTTAFFMHGEDGKTKDLWKDATYKQDATIGEGSKTLLIDVVAEGKKVTLTIKTDKETVGEALSEHKLIDGKRDNFGIYVKKVNGMVADYDKTQTFWAFNKDGEAMPTGVSEAQFSDGDHFELVCTK